MKKLLMFSALAMVMAAPVVMAEEGGDQAPGRKGPGGPHGNPEQMIEMIFNRHDLNKDGVISKEEFLKEAEERFAKMDTNSDGKVTKEEVKEHAKEMKEKFKERRQNREMDGDNPPPPPPPAEEE